MPTTDLNHLMLEMPKSLGADLSGIATQKTLAGGPPSTDLSAILSTPVTSVFSYFCCIFPNLSFLMESRRWIK
jgi:hypothetical protein